MAGPPLRLLLVVVAVCALGFCAPCTGHGTAPWTVEHAGARLLAHRGEPARGLGAFVAALGAGARPLGLGSTASTAGVSGRKLGTRHSLTLLGAKRGGSGGGQAGNKAKRGKPVKAVPFDVTAQRRANQDLHKVECEMMQERFNATLPDGAARMVFRPSDFVTITVDDGLVGDRNNFPFESSDLIHNTDKPLFSKEECDAVVVEAEAYAQARGGWSTQRHYSHPTTDIMLDELPQASEWFRRMMPTKLFPMIASCFPNVIKDPELLRIFDVFVVKYDSFEQSYLSVHRDSSLVSVTVALNPASDFEGGGMWIESLNKVVSLDQGQAVTFASNIRHGGHLVTKGLRYILVGFLLYEGYVEHDRRFLQSSQKSLALGESKLALDLCREALRVNPRRQEAWNNLGCMQRDAGDFESAMQSFQESVNIEPSYQEGWVNVGACQGMSGDSEGAITTARHALSINGRDARAHFNLGCALEHVGDLDGAFDNFGAAAALNPRDADPVQRRGQLHLAKGDAAAAVADLRKAAQLAPKSGPVFNDLGVALYEAGDVGGAVEAFLRAVENDPEDRQAADNAATLQQFLASQGQQQSGTKW